ncbi:MAG: SH3 domain-containing protein [Balneolaceae bacterium]|nr:SH3 domain-containing protein [Balneolaceae bacterium]
MRTLHATAPPAGRSTLRRSALLLALAMMLASAFPSLAAAQSGPQNRFDQANRLLQDESTFEALQAYRALESEGHRSGALYLNMGIASARIDSLGQAKFYFMKSRTYPETRQQAYRALENLENRFSRQSAVLPKLPWQRAVEWIQQNIGSSALMSGGLLLLNLGVVLIVVHWFRDRWKLLLRRGGIALVSAGLLLGLLSFYASHIDRRYSPAVMVDEQANVMEQPGSDAPIVSQAFEGYTLTVDHRRSAGQEGWSYVRLGNGMYGWIPTGHIRVL